MTRKSRASGRPTASHRAYEAIRDAISSGKYRIGERLTEGALAEELNVSRTPVREAMQRLASDGFVVFTPHTGALVRGWSAKEVRDVFDIRANLEGMAASQAAERATSDDVEQLEDLRRHWEAAVSSDVRDVPLISERNRAFHAEILRIADNHRLEAMCLQLMDLGFLTRSFLQFDQRSIESSSADHAALVKALRVRDARWAEALMRSHILAAASIFTGTDALNGEPARTGETVWPLGESTS